MAKPTATESPRKRRCLKAQAPACTPLLVTIRLYNTLSGKPEPVTPGPNGELGLYVCGPTVYDYAHIGHMRSALTYDVLVRQLRERALAVRYVRNITDVGDTIDKRAQARGQTSAQTARHFEDAYLEDTRRLSLIEPDSQPRVTDNIDAIIALIERLIAQRVGVRVRGRRVLQVQAFPAIRKALASQAPTSSTARVAVSTTKSKRKRDPLDFALWKGREPASPRGTARGAGAGPAGTSSARRWRMQYLGETFDIHGGGLDLIFPHHENEIAQAKPRPASSSRGSGCTAASSRSTARR